MPATEQTWRDTKRLHVIFGVSAVLMLLATIWMLAADHRREWKQYQRTFRNVESETIAYRIRQQDNDQYERDLAARQAELEAAEREVPPRKLIDQFRDILLQEAEERNAKAPDFQPVEDTYARLTEAAADADQNPESAKQARSERSKLIQQLEQFVADAKFRESNYLREKKFEAALFDVARSDYEIGVGNALPTSKLEDLEKKVEEHKKRVEDKAALAENAKVQRQALERVLAEIVGNEARARKALDEQKAKLDQLDKALREREDNFAKEFFALPIIDAFGRPLKVEQIWLPKLTINNNFRDVARFDRCTTCHQGLDKTLPGSAVEPAYRPRSEVDLTLATPAAATDEGASEPRPDPALAQARKDAERLAGVRWSPEEQALGDWSGLHLADRGLLAENDVTVSVVRPQSLAAKAGVNVGDVLLAIDGVRVLDKSIAYRYLVDSVNWGQPIKLKVQRGLPNPYTSHPRLDLFVGSLSPHKSADIGCTICHEGQGSATDFKWASHTPNTPGQATEWQHNRGWFNNHHWIFPMNPKRFAESSCLKCHHEVSELEASDRFPEPPAPKLLAGYDLIRQYGCFGCHEINGYDGPSRRIGPDMRAEPNYSAAAQALLATKDLNDDERNLARKVSFQPDDEAARKALLQSLRNTPSEKAGQSGGFAGEAQGKAEPRLSAAARRLAGVLEDVESPGKLRKVGPGLRHVASKLDYEFLYSWIRRPKDFRPTTKMPQFFELRDHLDGLGLDVSKRWEPIEIRGISEYLLTKSQPFDYVDPARGAEPGSVERGKKLFETRGCLACHQHADFPQAQMRQGPDLTRLGAKLDRKSNPGGVKWLYSWLRNPSNYHPRTLMPNLILDPIEAADGSLTDPAADISAYLLSSRDWRPSGVPDRKLSDDEQQELYNLALDYLKDAYPKRQATDYVRRGIPESQRGDIKGDEIELLGRGTADEQLKKQLLYVGRRAITKYGCSGCHDIPGYEDAKPIGTGLADWGRKSPDKLAFEQIAQYILHGHGHPQSHPQQALVSEHEQAYVGHDSVHQLDDQLVLDHDEAGHALNFEDMDPTTGFFMEKLMGHEREGFIWQKLREPRSYDYKKTENKGYNERLRMPQFNLDDTQREQVITFVLGLLAEPPAQQYVYKPQTRRGAIVEGSKVIEKFNCKGCHAFQMDRWELAYEPGDFSDPPKFDDYAFLEAHATPQQVKASLETDFRGLRHATLVGAPIVNEKTGQVDLVDSDGSPIEPDDTTSPVFAKFTPWENAVLNGLVRPAGLQNLFVPISRVVKRFPTPAQLREDPAGFGGYLPRLIYTSVLADERKSNPNAKGDEAWGWLPPPLVGEGRKVQTGWLHSFLLDPYPIRPAVVLRMPRFNMSSAEASALVNYFAAVDNANYPYDFDPRTREGYLADQEREEDHPHRLADALKIITDNNYCVKCHLIGDFEPTGSPRAKGPHLDEVYKRLRPDYTLRWIANPKRILPYTGMPVNIPPNKPASESLYPGSSFEQVNALVDLLMNFDRFVESRMSMKPLIKQPPPGAAEGQPAAGTGAQVPRTESLR